jgi:hypothetical protein
LAAGGPATVRGGLHRLTRVSVAHARASRKRRARPRAAAYFPLAARIASWSVESTGEESTFFDFDFGESDFVESAESESAESGFAAFFFAGQNDGALFCF